MSKSQLSTSTQDFLLLYLAEYSNKKVLRINRNLDESENLLCMITKSIETTKEVKSEIAKLCDSDQEELRNYLMAKITKYEKWKALNSKLLIFLYILAAVITYFMFVLNNTSNDMGIAILIFGFGIVIYYLMSLKVINKCFDYKMLQKYLDEFTN
jgi:hypothetical protein